MLKITKIIFGIICSFVFMIVLLSGSVFGILKLGLPACSIAGTIAMICGAAATICGSFLSARLAGKSGLLYGLVVSSIFSGVLIILGLVFNVMLEPDVVVLRITTFMICGALSGMLGVNHTQHIRF